MNEIIDTYIVYVKTDEDNIIIAVNSNAFISDIANWIVIDEGCGDKYHHAQNHYFDNRIIDNNGIYNYKLVEGKPVLRTDEEKSLELEKINALQKISELKANLAATDYIAAKIAEGAATREEYSEQIKQRAAWREEINKLEELYK